MPSEGHREVNDRKPSPRSRSGTEDEQRPRFHTPSGSRNLLREDSDRPSPSDAFGSGGNQDHTQQGSGTSYRHNKPTLEPIIVKRDYGHSRESDPRRRSLQSPPPHNYVYSRGAHNELPDGPISPLYPRPHSLPPYLALSGPPNRAFPSPVSPIRPFDPIHEFGRAHVLPPMSSAPVDRHSPLASSRHMPHFPPLAQASDDSRRSAPTVPMSSAGQELEQASVHTSGIQRHQRRSSSPSSRRPSTATASHHDDRRMPSGAVSSYFKGRTRVEQQHQPDQGGPIGISPPPSALQVTDERYPSAPPAHVAPARLPSPVLRQASQPKAWFSLDPPSPPRRRQWSPQSSQCYDLGFDDAVRAMENGWVGIGDSQYRHPLYVRRNLASNHGQPPLDSAFSGPSRHTAHDPTSPLYQTYHTSRPHPYPPPGIASVPPRHQYSHTHSPYDYGHTLQRSANYHTSPPAHVDTRYDPYYPPHYYTRQPASGVGMGPGRSQRQLISCYPCRSRKLKCDGVKPCVQCVRRGSESQCSYATHIRRRGKGKKALEDDTERSSEDRELSGSLDLGRGEGSPDSTHAHRRHGSPGVPGLGDRPKARSASVLEDGPREAVNEKSRRLHSPDYGTGNSIPSGVKLENDDTRRNN